jgi:hypothetical protein
MVASCMSRNDLAITPLYGSNYVLITAYRYAFGILLAKGPRYASLNPPIPDPSNITARVNLPHPHRTHHGRATLACP